MDVMAFGARGVSDRAAVAAASGTPQVPAGTTGATFGGESTTGNVTFAEPVTVKRLAGLR
ncbi:MAG: hypothetical protein H0V19_06205 [Euzebyales bacterium]|nr:hypothetical protein [Euzebyales bacterium]